jgi:hypothetical protein
MSCDSAAADFLDVERSQDLKGLKGVVHVCPEL